LKGFKEYLQGLGKSKFSREDIVNAMSTVTGKDHSGFFEYWSLMGIELDPVAIPALNTWYPEKENDVGNSTKYIPSMSMLAGDVPVKVVLDEKPLALDTEPVNKNGSLLVPLRTIVEALGAQVDWNGEDRSITITTNNKTVKMTIEDEKAYINGSEYILDAPPLLISGKTMVPLRFISEATGCKVYWYDTVKTVLIERQ